MPRALVAAVAVVALVLAGSVPPASAATGYDSAYAGESAFLELAPGASGTFTVFFANTGSAVWALGTSSQVDLAACLEDKVTCDAQDPQDAAFNGGWRGPTRYTTHTQATVAPGQIGTFTYPVKVPTDATVGVHRFNGALVVSATGQDVRNQGYFHEVAVTEIAPVPAAVLTSINPSSGTIGGGTVVTIAGSGIVCSPAPSVLFGTAAGTVTACGASSVQASTPAHAAGDVSVTVTNAGSTASNALTYTYVVVDTTTPTMSSAEAISTTQVRLTWSESVDCDISGTGTKAFSFTPEDGDTVNATAVACAGTRTTVTFPAGTFEEGVGGELHYRPSRLRSDDTPVQDGDGNEALSGDVPVPALAGPAIVDAHVDKQGLSLAADSQDKIILEFDTEMADPGNTGDAQLFVTDGDNTSAVIACTGAADDDDRVIDAECSLYFALGSSKRLSIALLEDTEGELSSLGGNGVLDWPATIEDTIGFEDATNGFSIDLDASTDVTIDAQ